MAVSVLMPNQPAQPAQREKESDLDKLLKGLQVASAGYGIYSDYNRLQIAKDQQSMAKQKFDADEQAIKDEKAGIITPSDQTKMFASGFGQAEGPGTGVIKRSITTNEGPSREVYFKTPVQVELEKAKRMQEIKKIADAAEDAAAKEDKTLTRATTLGNRYDQASKSALEGIRGYKKVEAAANNPNPTGATDVALLFGFYKTIDPGSTVREGEFANGEASQGIPDRVVNLRNKILAGERLTPEVRQNFLQEAKANMRSQLEVQQAIDQRFGSLSEQFGVDKTLVIDPQFQNELNRILSNQGDSIPYAPGRAPAVSTDDIDAELRRRGINP